MSASGRLADRIAGRLTAAGLEVSSGVVDGSAAYVELLSRWNRRINLTALPLADPIPDATLDKLVVEPLVAADLFASDEPTWFDLGSGGGSPAIPLRLARPAGRLTMVEARQRKCAFLREAVRLLNLERTEAVAVRFEDFAPSEAADVITVRAVRIDASMNELLLRLLNPGAQVFCFGGTSLDERFAPEVTRRLPDSSTLTVLRRR